MIRQTFLWIAVVLTLLIASCAKQSTPTGGPKDTIPPVLKSSIPKRNETNFKGKTIELTFDEMVMLNSAKEQIIIAPATSNPYEVTNRNTRVTIKFDEPLKDSTTYSINFRDAIQDVTEKNPAQNLQLAFSTGTFIDSLSISGNVLDLLKGTPPKEATVAIFPFNDTLSIFKHKPSFFTKTDKEGNFKLNNLKPGKYFVYTLEDKNRNLLADSRTEYYGFLTTPIDLKKDTSKVSLPLIKLDARPLKLTGARPYNNYFNLKTSKSLITYAITRPTSSDTVVSSFGEDHANIRVYDTFNADSTLIRLTASDSIGNSLDTSIYAKFTTRNITPDKFTLTVESTELLPDKAQLAITLLFNKPTFLVNPDSLLFLLDSSNVIQLHKTRLVWGMNSLNITAQLDPAYFKQQEAAQQAAAANRSNRKIIAAQPQDGSSDKQAKRNPRNQLLIGKGTFVSIDNDSSTHIEKTVPSTNSDELGVLIVTIQTPQTDFIAQLLDSKSDIIRETINRKTIRWEDVPPGDYKVRLILDPNKNGKWDPGNYLLKQEPEAVIYYKNPKATPPNTTHIKANWEVNITLTGY